MDEPFSGLDPVNATLLQDTLVDLRNQGRSILFSTHRMDQVEKLCDAIALINRGNLVLSGGVREIKSRYPRNRVDIIFDGDAGFLDHPTIESAKNYSGHAEIKLNDGASAQHLLAAAIENGTHINHFEVMEPTLEEIFIEAVGGKADA
jgi:ABC-2 type transport system ATP-binding protein